MLISLCLPVVTYCVCIPSQCMQDLLASEGQLVVLECRVRGVPSPQVDWYREGKLIEDSPEFRILQKSKLCCCCALQAVVFLGALGLFCGHFGAEYKCVKM